MFLPANILNFAYSILIFIVNGIFGSNDSMVFLIVVIHFWYTCGILVVVLFPVKLVAACSFGGGGLLHGCFSSISLFHDLLCERLFWWNYP